MKKTVTINLNKTVFHIDEDAYDLLQAYLSDVNHHFRTETGKTEILSDIEARIAELFIERLGKLKNVVTVEDVNYVVEIMGKPNQFSNDDEDDETEKEKTSTKSDEKTFTESKRFYRDVDNGLLGGVCSGLAAYLNWDTTLVRILLIVLVLVGLGSVIPIYAVVWLITPKAETTAQKMAMHGEVVNIETIKNKMNDTKNYLESDKFKESATEVGSNFLHFFQSLFKVIITFLGSILTIVGVVVASLLIFCLIIFLFQPELISNISPDIVPMMNGISSEKITLLIFSILFIIGCPIFALIYWSIRARSVDRATSNAPFWVALILWFAGIFMLLSTGSETFKVLKQNVEKIDGFYSWGDYNEDNPHWTSETRDITEPFYAIDASGVVNIELTYQKERSVVVSTVQEYLPKIKTEVKDGVLRIYSSDYLFKPEIKIKIGIDSLTAVYLSGATKIKFINSFPSKNIKVEMNGASDGYFNFSDAQNININLSGASKFEIEGKTKMLQLEANGASHADCENLIANDVDVNVSGASKADVNAIGNFNGQASGASSIDCSGNPKTRKADTSGTSNIDFDEGE